MNLVVLLSVTFFGFSLGAVLVCFARQDHTLPGPAPGLPDVLILLLVIAVGAILRVQLWRNWPVLALWLAGSMIISAICQAAQARRDRGNLLTQ